MFPDPLQFPGYVDQDKVPHVRTDFGDGVGEFTYADVNHPQTVTIKQNKSTRRFRREIRISRSALFTDPLSAVTTEQGASVYLVIDEPRAGFGDLELNNMVVALTTYLGGAKPTDNAAVLRLLAGEY